ncbi:MAG: hypothetical protein ABIP44_07205 [Pseudoxanthomonas sp.]
MAFADIVAMQQCPSCNPGQESPGHNASDDVATFLGTKYNETSYPPLGDEVQVCQQNWGCAIYASQGGGGWTRTGD